MSGNTSRRYPPGLKERAVRMVAEISDEHDSDWAAMNKVNYEVARPRVRSSTTSSPYVVSSSSRRFEWKKSRSV
jgi:transposase-like protein